jgi:PD-(D/E)XK nuclease superfamily
MNTWMECPKKAYFRYEEGLPEPQNAAASFGTVVHFALEHYNRTRDVDQALVLFETHWSHPEFLGVVPDIWPQGTSFDSYMDKGLAAIQGYHDQVRWTKRTVLAAEHKFLVPFGDHELTGYVDCLEVTGARTGQVLKIIDFKTAARLPFRPNLRQNAQFTVYWLATLHREFWVGNGPEFPGMPHGESLWEKTQDLPRKAVWYALIQQKAVDAGPRDQADFMRLYRVADEMQRALDHRVFVPNISGDSCGFCPYTLPCGLAVPPSLVPDDE